ncbi:hypothetical protein QBC35DRAFT_372198 [Podospora australis]|uniref:DUF8004 domain-containing protein n=1 Tax=Podospora australis TaxID=1536484 RepID=A0AAN6X757_9PEZI|nr:hypothetical protein QBC35DRAFT_372198 [Podospora australis]
MPVAKPPPVPTMQTQYASPALVPTVMATDATPTSERRQRPRSLSPEGPRTAAKLQPNRLQPRQASPAPKGRSVSAQPPLTRVQQNDALRAVSNPHPIVTRPDSVASSEGSPTSSSGKKVRKSWLPGARSRSNSADMGKPKGTGAWIMSPDHQVDYNVAPLFSGEKVPELWNEMGNVLVYLHPKESGLGPSFKVSDYIFSSSLVLNELLLQDMMASASMGSHFLGIDDAERQRPPPSRNSNGAPDGHLYLPPGNVAGSPAEDLNRLVAARNLFAFLTNQPLVGTEANPTLFAAILQISSLLRHFNFTNHDGSSFGDSVEASFDMLLDQFHIHDVRHSREKTIEALILGEQMKSWNLYNEAFAHAVGKYESLIELKSPLYERVSIDTRERLERAHFALGNRLATASLRLESFEFPSLFAGTANSTSNEDYRQVRFKEWRNSFLKMRHFVLGYYKDLFGSWPPKAKSKKNNFSQGGLNRQCLKILYSDLCALYDLLVDRQSLTPRVIDQETPEEKDDKEKMDLVTACISALRRMLSEFEQSTPPVLPPIPYDTPKVPSMTSIHENYNELPPKKQAKFDKLQSHELQLLLIKSRNIDTDALTMPFLLAFKEFELKEAKGAHPHGLIDQRMGYWLFLYVVLQSLPMLVVDAPGLHFTEGVEYFLCEAPQGNPPWAEDAGEVRKVWYQTADRNVVELSADVVMFSVEGIYMRSHCWLAAKEWQVAGLGGVVGGLPPPAITSDLDSFASPLHPPQAVFQDMDPVNAHQRRGSGSGSVPDSPHVRPRSGSPGHRARHAYRASIAMGLEPLPLQGGPMPGSDRSSMVPSRHGSGSSSPVGTPSGLGAGEMYQQGQGQGLRQSRSAVNLGQQHAAGERKLSYGGGPNVPNNYGGEPPLPLAHPPTMPAAMPAHGHAREGSNGGSTFDDILKGMDKGKKPKKKLFGL